LFWDKLLLQEKANFVTGAGISRVLSVEKSYQEGLFNMAQQATKYYPEKRIARPKRRDIFFHAIKTSKLIGALTRDRRISIIRKVCFFAVILGLLAILLFPDFFDEAFLSIVLPIVGTVLGIPLDAGFDWLAFALIVVSLLRIFPAEIVGEHYQRLFKRA
jgi:hypothetical protein